MNKIDLRTRNAEDDICYIAEQIIHIIENNDAEIVVDYDYKLVHYKISLEVLGYDFPKSPDSRKKVFKNLDDQISEILWMRGQSDGHRFELSEEELFVLYGNFDNNFRDKRGRYDYHKEIEEGEKYYAWKKEREKRDGYHLIDDYLLVPARGEGMEYLL